MTTVKRWTVIAKEDQETYSSMYARSLKFELSDNNSIRNMKTIIAFGFYGVPELEANKRDLLDTDDLYTYYNDDQKKKIDNVLTSITETITFHRRLIYLKNTFLLCKIKGVTSKELSDSDDYGVIPTCLYAFSFDDCHYKFVDMSGRIYKNWADFTENNQLPECTYCCPKGGIYRTNSNIEFRLSPSATIKRKLTNFSDAVTTFGAIGSAVVPFLVTNPIGLSIALGVGITSGVYGLARNVNHLYDRASHRQSISLGNADSRSCWMNIVAGSLTAGTTSAVCRSTYLFQRFGTTATNSIRILNGITVAVDVASLGNSLLDLWIKHEEGERVTTRDILNVSLQVMFLCGAVTNARRIHQEMTGLKNRGMINKVMTKLQKMNAKGKGIVAKWNKTVLAQTIDKNHGAMITRFLQNFPQHMFPIVRCYYRPAENIWHHFHSVVSNIRDYKDKKLDLMKFLDRTHQHLINLFKILYEEWSQLKDLFNSLNIFPSSKTRQSVGFTLDDAVTEINSFEIEETQEESNDRVHTSVVTTFDRSFNFDSTHIVVKHLSDFIKECTVIFRDSYNTVNNRLYNEVDLCDVYISSLTDTIDCILLNSLIIDEDKFAINKSLYGKKIASLIELKEREIISERVLSALIKQYVKNNMQKTMSQKYAAYSRRNYRTIPDFEQIYSIRDTIVKMLQLLVKTRQDMEITYNLEFILLKELLVEISEEIYAGSIQYLANNFSAIIANVLIKLQNDSQFSNDYYKSYNLIQTECFENSRSINGEDTKHKKILELSCLCFYRLTNSGFEIENDVDRVFNVIIDFIKTKILDGLKQFNQTRCDNPVVFNRIFEDLTNRCFSDDLFLAECIEHYSSRSNLKKGVSIWTSIIDDIGIEAYWRNDLVDIMNDDFLKTLCEQFGADWKYMKTRLNDKTEGNILFIEPTEDYICDVEIIVCKISGNSEGFIIVRKVGIVDPDNQ